MLHTMKKMHNNHRQSGEYFDKNFNKILCDVHNSFYSIIMVWNVSSTRALLCLQHAFFQFLMIHAGLRDKTMYIQV